MKTTKRLTEHILEVGRKGPFYVNDVSKYAYGYFLYFFFCENIVCLSYLRLALQQTKFPILIEGVPRYSLQRKKKKKNINIVDKQATSACIIVVVK